MHIQVPDYAQLECISRGNKVLGKKGDERILESDEVNTLVRHYSHLEENTKRLKNGGPELLRWIIF